MLVFHPAFHPSSYILPRDPQERLRSNEPLDRTIPHMIGVFSCLYCFVVLQMNVHDVLLSYCHLCYVMLVLFTMLKCGVQNMWWNAYSACDWVLPCHMWWNAYSACDLSPAVPHVMERLQCMWLSPAMPHVFVAVTERCFGQSDKYMWRNFTVILVLIPNTSEFIWKFSGCYGKVHWWKYVFACKRQSLYSQTVCCIYFDVVPLQ